MGFHKEKRRNEAGRMIRPGKGSTGERPREKEDRARRSERGGSRGKGRRDREREQQRKPNSGGPKRDGGNRGEKETRSKDGDDGASERASARARLCLVMKSPVKESASFQVPRLLRVQLQVPLASLRSSG